MSSFVANFRVQTLCIVWRDDNRRSDDMHLSIHITYPRYLERQIGWYTYLVILRTLNFDEWNLDANVKDACFIITTRRLRNWSSSQQRAKKNNGEGAGSIMRSGSEVQYSISVLREDELRTDLYSIIASPLIWPCRCSFWAPLLMLLLAKNFVQDGLKSTAFWCVLTDASASSH